MLLTTIATIAAIGAAGVGAGTSIANSETASDAAQIQNDAAQSQERINAQRMQDQQAVYNKLFPFYSQYLDKGSPFLANMQSQTASQNAQQYNNAAGNVRQTMQTSGLGYGPSGATGAAIGELGAQEANQSASSYLQNLLNNENVKFQAAQGLTAASPSGTGQNMPTNEPTATTFGSSFDALGKVLQNLINQNTNTSKIPQTPVGQYPLPTNPANPTGGTIPTFPGGWPGPAPVGGYPGGDQP